MNEQMNTNKNELLIVLRGRGAFHCIRVHGCSYVVFLSVVLLRGFLSTFLKSGDCPIISLAGRRALALGDVLAAIFPKQLDGFRAP